MGLLRDGGNWKIYESEGKRYYHVVLPEMSDVEKEVFEVLRGVISRETSVSMIKFHLLSPHFQKILFETLKDLLDSLPSGVDLLSPEEKSKALQNISAYVKKYLPMVRDPESFARLLLYESLGMGLLEYLMEDDNLEEIMVNGEGIPVYVVHREYGVCETNITLPPKKVIKLASKVARYVNKPFSELSPILDAHLPTGDRVNATMPSITPKGPTLTIRKFRKIPFSPADLLNNGTISPEAMAFLWLAVEGMGLYPLNIIISGNTGGGKTTLLNVLLDFVPLEQRIITIEDTLELDLGERKNWIQMVSRPATRNTPEVTMDDLVKTALRMRPDRIIVGEVRGEEARTLFTAMDIGHQGSMGTLHANTTRETIIRLKTPPMSVPESLLPLLNLIVMVHRMYRPDRGIYRRVTQISEVTRMEERVLLADLYKWSPEKDELRREDIPSHNLDLLSKYTGRSRKKLKEELELREVVLRYMSKEKMGREECRKVINRYYQDKKGLLEEIKTSFL